MKNIVILISGRGSNMEAIVRACAAERWPARIAAVVSNRADAPGLAFAASQGIATAVVEHGGYADREAFDAALAQTVDRFSPDLVVLAGFMRVLTSGFVERYSGRMLNVHPSLLPSFPGLRTHERALEAGVVLHGATVHFVTSQLDHGPIVVQGAIPVTAADDARSLAQRLLAVEHVIYPRAVRWFVEDRLTLSGLRVVVTPPEPQWYFSDTLEAAV
ncbi:phosphoribosylglycinamide formyltransferase [Trinickia soli]|uniref:Phosphoribosylglycinamide formyltransferase n=1 Tax=Trinickia soli TaxID=380675 RepID=A0A2N7VGJ2_9BURK|nr:phosphoribosylglycinamide formyltransferase [Trinickia soli]KAA0075601.1 phosphoribosylglycinamide formyltransferase [Paraburkholderia sp. T12-10]PMS16254.1 phosphoribosylglycinamide formyltransferase [Trinickia soli]CAB3728737.1 Phosphoribosylglycinamide formyltransferase [Trinickia soli]